MEPQKRLNIIKHCNPSGGKKKLCTELKRKKEKERKSDTCILKYWQFVSRLFPVNFILFFVCVQQFSKLLDIKR